VADRLVTDLQDLVGRVPKAEISATSMANGAAELLDEVSHTKVTGEEEAFSHTDLVDIQANVDGAARSSPCCQPVLAAKNADLAARSRPASPACRRCSTATGRGRLPLLHDDQRGRAAQPLGRRRRRVRAAEPADRGGLLVTAPGDASTSRRAALGLLGGTVALGAAGVGWAVRAGNAEAAVAPVTAVPFHGDHQAGIASAVQDRLHMAAFDLRTGDRAAVVRMLRALDRGGRADDARPRDGRGRSGPAVLDAPPEDTGEALALPPARLTLTLGLGAGFFAKTGLAGRRPRR
jgi:hypothetical protein